MYFQWIQKSPVSSVQDQTVLCVGCKEIQWKEVDIFLPLFLLWPVHNHGTVEGILVISAGLFVDLPSLSEVLQ